MGFLLQGLRLPHILLPSVPSSQPEPQEHPLSLMAQVQ